VDSGHKEELNALKRLLLIEFIHVQAISEDLVDSDIGFGSANLPEVKAQNMAHEMSAVVGSLIFYRTNAVDMPSEIGIKKFRSDLSHNFRI
jgi:hypothetical protein